MMCDQQRAKDTNQRLASVLLGHRSWVPHQIGESVAATFCTQLRRSFESRVWWIEIEHLQKWTSAVLAFEG